MKPMAFSLHYVRRIALALACVALALIDSGSLVRAQATTSSSIEGQSVTTLPDGRQLLLGGTAKGQVQAGAWLRDVATGALVTIGRMNQARAWQTATLLPDGSVLVLGGTDARGRAVREVERFDPTTNTFEKVQIGSWRSRSAHTATLVDDSHIVVAGGVVGGQPTADVDVIDIDMWRASSVGRLSEPRAFHSATLSADGRAILWGGRGADPNVATSGVIIDLAGPMLTDIFAPELDGPLPSLAASEPADRAIDAIVPQRITLRFSRPARVETLNSSTVTLAGPAGDIALKVVPAEGGRLAFITPTAALETNTTYLVTVNGARDSVNTHSPVLSVTFSTGSRTSGLPSYDDEIWDPRSGGPTWRTNWSESSWQKLPPLRAQKGVTALSGQALRLTGSPLAGVRMQIDRRSVMTDDTGRFLLINQTLSTGWHELWIDGGKARANGTYGTFEAAVWVNAGDTTVLPYTIWMPKIDTAHAVTIESPTKAETVVTTPLIPGLEVRLPPGAVITDHDGKVVRQLTITPIPVDQPPFPLAEGVDVPIYFTVQPGGAYINAPAAAGYRGGARLIYPNYRNRPTGTRGQFWHYEPEGGRRWYVYGEGTVTGSQVIPDQGVSVDEFTGAMFAPPNMGGGPPGRPPGDPIAGGEPVFLGTGLFVMNKTDLFLGDVTSVAISRTYRQNDTVVRSFGIGASHQYDMFLVGDTSPYTYADLVLPDGGRVHYTRISSGTGYADAVYEHTSSPTGFFKSRISWNGNGWNLDLKDGSRITFREGFTAVRPSQAAATSIRDRYGNTVTLTRDAAADLTQITSPNGRVILLTYDTSHRVTEARDTINRVVQYTYDASGRLWKVTDPAGGVTEYTYDMSHRLLTIKDPRGIVYLTNQYDANGRVSLQTQADNTTYQFAYILDGAGKVIQADVTDPRGHVRRVTYGSAGYLLTDTSPYGNALARTTSYTRNSNNLVTRMTDGLGRNTDYAYDAQGNVTSVTRLAGTGNAVTTGYTYDVTFNQVASITDPLNHTTTLTRDSLGNLTTITDPLSHQTTFTYNTAGQPLTMATAVGSTQFAYEAGDLVSVTDPLGRVTSHFFDSTGRLVRTTNPSGQITQNEYSPLSLLTKTTDALGGQTTFTYDGNGNLLTLTDALNHTTTYTYNNMDRVATRTDPLTRQESYVYDGNGNLQQVTDRKNQVTAYTYDALNRLSTVTYADNSTTVNTYDAANRLTQVVDSMAGTITRTLDSLDRLTSETTPEGSISYTYDAAARRATMTVAGQPQVTYGYDNDNRLTSITQSSNTVGFSYDNVDRRTVLTLPNSVTVEYGYDAASQIIDLTYKVGANALGNLTYTYDSVGNRTAVNGTWARTGLPAALTSATYDAANQITSFGGTSFSYDANGNLAYDGSKTYGWNARNQLIGVSGGGSASFQYDGLGRRRSKTVSGTTASFLYDKLNIVQEIAAGSPSANILPGLGIDEWFLRTDSVATRYFLTDALNSILALVDASGVVQTAYTYEPFGGTTVTGTASTNALQYGGRENDGSPLHFHRARYYDARLQRFLNEDPIGFGGGNVNLHGYALNNPLRWVDSVGLCVPVCVLPFIPPAAAALAEAALWTGGTIAAAAAGQSLADWLAAKFAQHGKQGNVEHSHHEGVSSEELGRRLNDPSTPAAEKQKIKGTLKGRGDRPSRQTKDRRKPAHEPDPDDGPDDPDEGPEGPGGPDGPGGTPGSIPGGPGSPGSGLPNGPGPGRKG